LGRVGNVTVYIGAGIILAVLTCVLMQLKGLYAPDSLLSVRPKPILVIWGGVFLFLLAISFSLKISDELSRGSALSLAVVAPCLILLGRVLLRRAILTVLAKGWLKRRRILLITCERDALDEGMRPYGYDVVHEHVLAHNPEDIRREVAALVAALRASEPIDEVHLAVDWSRWADVKNALFELRALPLPVRLIADGTARDILQHPQHVLGGLPSFELQRPPLSPAKLKIKRGFDFTIAALALFSLAPFLLLVTLAIKLDSPGPVLFKQKRGGRNGQVFQILKFRTMRVMEDGDNIAQAARNDPRVTRLGSWLRRASVDELPQLFNVLRGDMSLVGPRPHALAHDEQYRSLIARYPFRHHIKPGITGWAQVNGLRGATTTVELMNGRVELDLWYISNWSFWLDIRILLRTSLEVFRSDTAF
jgi:Undecaprenyl-phosphate glucose phosphotransferase